MSATPEMSFVQRELERLDAEAAEIGQPDDPATWRAFCTAALARLEAAEGEGARLRREADVLYGAVVWMSGSPSFGPEGEAHEGWLKVRERVQAAREALAQSEGLPS